MNRDRGRLLVFTLGPGADARRHPVLPASHRPDEVFLRKACFDAVVLSGIEEGLEVVVSAPEPIEAAGASWRPQGTGTFGERLTRAVAASFDETSGPLIVVGTDSPGLSSPHLAEARRKVEENPDTVVLGPAPDGGFYLLAAARPLGAVLNGIPWCGAGTRRALVAALRRSGRPVQLLRPLRDLDRPSDAARVLRGAVPLPSAVEVAAQAIRRALRQRRQWLPAATLDRPSFVDHDPSLGRAPPLPNAA